jgi:hypothetical protein
MSLPALELLPEPLGPGTRACPTCGQRRYLRYRKPVIYCLNCMTGMGSEGHGPAIDVSLFPTINEEHQATFGK